MTTVIERFRPLFMVVTFGFLGAAFFLAYRPGTSTQSADLSGGAAAGGRGRSKIMAANKIMLWAVTVIAVVFLFFPQAVTGLFASGSQFTADMDRTVITVEGMT